MATEARRILVADDEEVVRLYLEALLTGQGYEVAMARDYDEAKKLVSEHRFDLIIADLVFLDESYSGLDVIECATAINPDCESIVFTSYPSTHTAVASLRMRVADYLTKPSSQQEILAAVEKVFVDHHLIQEDATVDDSGSSLSQREREVLLQLYKGFHFNEVAENLNCSISTAKTYGRRIYKKLGVNSRSEAVHEAIRQGVIRVE